MSVKSRLKSLEKTATRAAGLEPPWASPEVYARLREDTQDSIDSDLAIGEEPLYRIDDEGRIRAADDDSFVRHLGDYVQALDRRIARLDREIDKERANMSPEEIQRADAEHRRSRDALLKLSLDEGIALLKAEIAEANAEIAREEAEQEGEGVGAIG